MGAGLSGPAFAVRVAHLGVRHADSILQVFHKVTGSYEPPPPRNAGALTEVIMGLLRKDPEERWTADRAAKALAEIADGEDGRD